DRIGREKHGVEGLALLDPASRVHPAHRFDGNGAMGATLVCRRQLDQHLPGRHRRDASDQHPLIVALAWAARKAAPRLAAIAKRHNCEQVIQISPAGFTWTSSSSNTLCAWRSWAVSLVRPWPWMSRNPHSAGR